MAKAMAKTVNAVMDRDFMGVPMLFDCIPDLDRLTGQVRLFITEGGQKVQFIWDSE